MQRVTVTLDRELLAAVDALAARRGYAGRSEAMRDLLRRSLADATGEAEADTDCVATLSFVAEAATRDLGQRLADTLLGRHDLVLAQMGVPLDHDATLHALVLRGPLPEVRAFADALATQRGIRHDSLAAIPARIETNEHRHGPHPHPHPHIRT